MEKTLELLTNAQPVILITLLAGFWIIESFIPWFANAPSRKKHSLNNYGMILMSLILNGIASVFLMELVSFNTENKIGLMNLFSLPTAATIIVGMLLIDFWDYWYHMLTHKWKWMWKWHRIHHSDTHLDSTSSLRFHPFEIVFQFCNFYVQAIVLGIPMEAYIFYFTLQIGLIIVQHVNVKFPHKLDYVLSFIFSTPEFHKVHHSSDKKLTDSHYGDVFTFWDKLFGTYNKQNVNELQFGIEDYREEKDQSIKAMLTMPFKP